MFCRSMSECGSASQREKTDDGPAASSSTGTGRLLLRQTRLGGRLEAATAGHTYMPRLNGGGYAGPFNVGGGGAVPAGC